MENKNKFLILFIVIFLLITCNLIAQERPVHRLTWENEYALRYEIIIQRQTVNEEYEDFFNDFTAEQFIELTLPAGQYRFQIIPYDMLDRPGEPSYWAYVNVLPITRMAEAEEKEEPEYIAEIEEEEIEEITKEEIPYKEITKGDFWLGFTGDFAFYSADGYAYGGGLTLGYGKAISFGIKAAWFLSREDIDTFELSVLMRFYFIRVNPYYGPFIQFMGGYSYYYPNGEVIILSELGNVNLGGVFGWRFLLSNNWYIEPYIRAGYPYMGGAGIVFGFRHGEKVQGKREKGEGDSMLTEIDF